MTLEIPSFTIRFHPENKKLWEFLQTLSPIQQESVVLQALKEYLEKEDQCQDEPFVNKLAGPLVNEFKGKANGVTPGENNEDLEGDKEWIREDDEEVFRKEKGFNDSWDLESLFISSDSALGDLIQKGSFLDQENRKDQKNRKDQENRDSVNRELGRSLGSETVPPLKHLFELLGEEDDEDVLQLLQRNQRDKHQSIQQGTPVAYASEGEEVKWEETERTSEGQPLENPECHESQESVLNPKLSSGLNFLLQHVIGEEEDEEVLRYFRPSSANGIDNS